MWWEILPAYLVIFAAVFIPHVVVPQLNYLVVGNHYRRGFPNHFAQWNYLRDRRIDENMDPYIVHGLENIADVDEEEERRAKEQREREEEEERRRQREAEEEEARRLAEEEAKRQAEEQRKADEKRAEADRAKSSAAARKPAGTSPPPGAKGEAGESPDAAPQTEESSEPCKRTPKERDMTKEYRLEDDDPCRK